MDKISIHSREYIFDFSKYTVKDFYNLMQFRETQDITGLFEFTESLMKKVLVGSDPDNLPVVDVSPLILYFQKRIIEITDAIFKGGEGLENVTVLEETETDEIENFLKGL